MPDLQVAQLPADAAGLLHLSQKAAALLVVAHRRPAARGRPHRRHQRSRAKPLGRKFSARRARSSSDESMSVWGSDRNRSTPSKRTPSTSAAAVSPAWFPDRWAAPNRDPSRPSPATWRYAMQDSGSFERLTWALRERLETSQAYRRVHRRSMDVNVGTFIQFIPGEQGPADFPGRNA